MRLLPAGARIYNVILDGIIDTSEDCRAAGGTLLLGDLDSYEKNLPDSMKNITVYPDFYCTMDFENDRDVKHFITRE